MDGQGEIEGEDHIDDVNVEPPFVTLMDTLAFDTLPPARRLIELLEERGWTGWTKLERVKPNGVQPERQENTTVQRSRR